MSGGGREAVGASPSARRVSDGGALHVAVLMGGASGEREVSLASGAQVARALSRAGHRVTCFDTVRGVLSASEIDRLLESGVGPPSDTSRGKDLLAMDPTALVGSETLRSADVLFPVLHGGSGEDGTLQAILDLAGLPYAGSGRVGCTLAMDKEVTKRLLREAGIPTPEWRVSPVDLAEVEDALGYPVIVKPPSGGSTLGLTLAQDRASLERAVSEALRYEDRVLFERYVRGRELTVGVVGDEALPVGEIIPAHELFDYECKYRPGMAEEIFPAALDPDVSREVRELALRVHRLLLLRDFSRVDFILDEDGTPWCLEANALPGLTEFSLLPKAARAAGVSFPALCDRMVRLAMQREAGRHAG